VYQACAHVTHTHTHTHTHTCDDSFKHLLCTMSIFTQHTHTHTYAHTHTLTHSPSHLVADSVPCGGENTFSAHTYSTHTAHSHSAHTRLTNSRSHSTDTTFTNSCTFLWRVSCVEADVSFVSAAASNTYKKKKCVAVCCSVLQCVAV